MIARAASSNALVMDRVRHAAILPSAMTARASQNKLTVQPKYPEKSLPDNRS